MLWAAPYVYEALRLVALFVFYLAQESLGVVREEEDEYEYEYEYEADSEDEASDIPDALELARARLGLRLGFTREELNRAYKAAIRKAHPDLGGSVKDAQAINNARDVLLRAHGWA